MSLFGTGRREGFLAVLILVVLAVAIHAPGIFFGRHRLASDPSLLPPHQQGSTTAARQLQTESAVNQTVVLPSMQRAGDVLRGGELPLWNDKARFGEPFTVTGAPLLYPPFWLLLLPDGWRWLDVLMCLHSILACGFMYRFLRVTSLGRYVAFLGGGMYGLGWFLTAQMDRLPSAAAVALLPAALELTWRVTAYGRERLGPLLGVAVAAGFWTGGTEIALFGLFVCVSLFSARMFAIDRYDRWLCIKTAGIGAIVAIFLTAPCWLDFLQHMDARADHYAAPLGALQPAGLLGMWSPIAFGNLQGAGPQILLDVSPGVDPLQLVLYPGALALFLVALGLFRPKRTWAGLFWIVIGGLGLLLTLDSPIRDVAQQIFGWEPGVPGAGLLLLHLGVIVLACVAMENFFEAPAARAFAVPTTAGIALLVAAAWLGTCIIVPSWGEAVVASLTGAEQTGEIAAAAKHLGIALMPAMAGLALVGVLFFMWHWLGLLRFKAILAVAALGELLLISGWVPARTAAEAPMTAFADRMPETPGRLATTGASMPSGSAAMAAGIATINTDADTMLQRTVEYLRLVESGVVDVGARARVGSLQSSGALSHPLLAFAGVDSAVSSTPFASDTFTTLTAAPGTESDASLVVAARPAEKWARIVYEVVPVASSTEAATKMASSRWPLETTVFLEDSDPLFECKCVGAEAVIERIDRKSNSSKLHVTMGKERGYLVIADAWAPGWRATVDGDPVTIHPANIAFRAIPLDEGEHEIEFEYRPISVSLGLPLLGFGGVLAAGLSLLLNLRRRN